MPAAALAHASERMLILTLPTGRSILGAAAAVALTALLLPLAPRLPAPRPRRLLALPHAAGADRGAGSRFSSLAALRRARLARAARSAGEPAAADDLDPALGRADAGEPRVRRSLARDRSLERPGDGGAAAARAARRDRAGAARLLAGGRGLSRLRLVRADLAGAGRSGGAGADGAALLAGGLRAGGAGRPGMAAAGRGADGLLRPDGADRTALVARARAAGFG